MKPRTPRLLALPLWCLSLALALGKEPARAADSPAPIAEQSPSASPAGTSPATPATKGKAPRDKNATPKPAKERKAKVIQFPVPRGDVVHGIKIPKLDVNGTVLQLLSSLTMENRDDEHVVMHEAKIDLYHPDGKEDFHVLLPESTLNLKTNIITSDRPVTVSTQDFELTGDRMQFNTVDRTGELQGHVHMVIRNLKQVAGAIPSTPAP